MPPRLHMPPRPTVVPMSDFVLKNLRSKSPTRVPALSTPHQAKNTITTPSTRPTTTKPPTPSGATKSATTPRSATTQKLTNRRRPLLVHIQWGSTTHPRNTNQHTAVNLSLITYLPDDSPSSYNTATEIENTCDLYTLTTMFSNLGFSAMHLLDILSDDDKSVEVRPTTYTDIVAHAIPQFPNIRIVLRITNTRISKSSTTSPRTSTYEYTVSATCHLQTATIIPTHYDFGRFTPGRPRSRQTTLSQHTHTKTPKPPENTNNNPNKSPNKNHTPNNSPNNSKGGNSP